MSLISRITTWTSQILTSSSLNGEFNNVINTINNLDSATTPWTNVKVGTLTVTGTASFASSTAPFSGFASYTPTIVGGGSVTSVAMFWRRIGDVVQIRGNFTTGTCTAVTATMTLPNSITTDTTKVPQTQVCGNVASAASVGSAIRVVGVAASNIVYFSLESTNGLSGGNGSAVWSNASLISVQFEVPITGWTF